MVAASVPDASLAGRIRLLASFLIFINLGALVASVLIFPLDSPDSNPWAIILALIALPVMVQLYIFAATPYARYSVYATLTLLVGVLAAIDPLTGSLGGDNWVLFQLVAPMAALVLREPRTTMVLAAIASTALLVVALLQINEVIVVRFLAEKSTLYFNLCMQIVVLFVLATIIGQVTAKEQQAFARVLVAQQESSTQLQRVQELLGTQQGLNEQLQQSIDETRQRDALLAKEAANQRALRQTIAAMAAPIMPILPGVVVVPLVGVFDALRLDDLTGLLLHGIEAYRARTVILDLTGTESMDELLGAALLRAAAAGALLGSQVILVGISPEGAQAFVSLGVDLSTLRTSATLQEAMRTVLRQAPQLA